MPIAINIKKSNDGKPAIVEVAGSLDRITYFEFKNKMLSILEAGQYKIVVDASKLVFCDSTGLVGLIEINNRAKYSEGFFRLAAVPGTVIEVINTIGLTAILKIYKTVEEAMLS